MKRMAQESARIAANRKAQEARDAAAASVSGEEEGDLSDHNWEVPDGA